MEESGTSCASSKTGRTLLPRCTTRARWWKCSTPPITPECSSAANTWCISRPIRATTISTRTSPCPRACHPERRCSRTSKAWATGSCSRRVVSTVTEHATDPQPRSARIGVFLCDTVAENCGRELMPFLRRRTGLAPLSLRGLGRRAHGQIRGPTVRQDLPRADRLADKYYQILPALFAPLSHRYWDQHLAAANVHRNLTHHFQPQRFQLNFT